MSYDFIVAWKNTIMLFKFSPWVAFSRLEVCFWIFDKNIIYFLKYLLKCNN